MWVRKATSKDIKVISKIFSSLNNKYYQPSNLKEIKKGITKKNIFVALEKNKIIAAIQLQRQEKNYEIIWLASIKKGGGKSLAEFAITKCKKEKILKLWCWSLTVYQAKGFYKKMGFEEIFLLKKQWHGKDCYFCGKIIR